MKACTCRLVRMAMATAALVALFGLPARALAQVAHGTAPAQAESPAVVESGAGEPAQAGGPETAGAVHDAGTAGAGEHGEAEHEGGGLVSLIAKLFNFAILVGTLVYFLRSPLASYLTDRGRQVREALVLARRVRESAAAELAAVDERLRSLPGELDALRAQGAVEVAAEQERIRRAAAAERDRLVEQVRREIGAQLRIARRTLVTETADLAVGVARARLQASLTHEDQLRLMDRYASEVAQRHE